jgi:phosphate transport system protein
MLTPHLDQAYEAEITELRIALLRTGARAETMVRDSVRALLTRDPELARAVMATDRELDRLELELDKRCVSMLARRSPVGEDLRLVMCALKSDVDMERVGDLAEHIAERAIELATQPGFSATPELVRLANGVVEIVERAMASLANGDAAGAKAAIAMDKQLDALHGDILRSMIQVAKDHPDQLERTLAWSSVSRHLERVGDHACNIAEMTVFLVDGKVLRHGGLPRG